MKLLFLVHRIPYPPDRGDRIRSWRLLRYLAERAEVDVACLADEPVSNEQREALARTCRRAAIVPLGRRSRWGRAVRSLIGGRSATEGLFYSRRLAKTLKSWTGDGGYDRVVAFCSSMSPYLDLPALASVPKFVDLVDVDSQKWFDYASAVGGAKRRFFGLEGRRVRTLETELARKTDALLVVSEPEAELLRSFCPSANVHAVSNGVDLDYFYPAEAPVRSPQSLVFVGALDYRANVDGVTWFCREAWPGIRARYPKATLSLVGRNPVLAVRELTSLPGVELVGQVADIRPFVAAASVAIAPLRVARGVQNKVLEGVAMGKPVIASSGALQGLDLVPGEHVLCADSSEEWGGAVSTLFDDPAERERLAAAGRSFVEHHYAWNCRLAPLAELLGLHTGQHLREAATHLANACAAGDPPLA